MRTSRSRWSPGVLALVALLLVLTGAAAASEIGVYFDADGDENTQLVQPFAAFNWYIVARGVSGDVQAYSFKVEIDSRLTVTGRVYQPDTAINIGQDENWVVGTGQALDLSSPYALVIYTGMLFSASDNVRIGLGGSRPPSGGLPFDSPNYALADGSTVDFDEVTTALLNPAQRSWGALKGLYDSP